MRVIDCIQRSPEWYAARTGRPTASRFRDALACLKNGNPAQAQLDYASELVMERLTGDLLDKAVTFAMQRGIDLEPIARHTYESRTGEIVEEIGVALHDHIEAGCSPDGLVGSDGLIEIKCPLSASVVLDVWATDDASAWLDQIQGQMWITGKAWCDLVVYDPRLERAGMDLYIKRIKRDDEHIACIDSGIAKFIDRIDTLYAKLLERRKTCS